MKNISRIISKAVRFLLFIPLLIIVMVVLFELFGAIVNSLATSNQTKRLKNSIEEHLQNEVVSNTLSKTGNTSGTGNHVDILSVVVFQTEANTEQITAKMQEKYEFADWYCWV